ncbi:hypothetical protein [Streptomyces sp. NPDC048565]|uniref:hypothetical protein n=1 Tax=Streptomyces sp. NPDC048565 TaxID=3155266 RepID=UPI00343ADBE7
MDTTCSICHGHAPAEHYLCDACQYRLHTWLREIPQHLPLLQDLLRPGSGPAQRGGGGRAHSPLPVDLRVLDLLGPGHVVPWVDAHGDQTGGVPLEPLLYGWARYIASELPSVHRDAHGTVRIQPCTGPWARRGADVPAWCAWLQAYLPYAARQPWAHAMYEQLEETVHRIRRLTHTRPGSRPMDAPCPGCSGFALQEREDELHISCTVCSVRLTREQYADHRAVVMPGLVRTALLMQAAHEQARRTAA